ncbi:MAG: FixH family protein [Solibacillus sp.]
MKKWMYSLVAIPVLLFGCGGEEPEVDTLDNGVMPVEVVVEIQTAEHLNVNETIQLAARVTQGDEAVDDAEEVKFEVWESGLREDGQMLNGKLIEDGIYAIDHTFDHDGVYYMFAHTTARGLHVMPKQQLVVGNPDMSKVVEDESSSSMDHGAGHEENTDSEEKDSH